MGGKTKFERSQLEHHWVYEPQCKNLLLLVHGRGGQWRLMEWFAKRAYLQGKMDFLCLQAPHPEDVPEMKQPGFSWYVGSGKQGLEKSREQLDITFEELEAMGYASRRVFWLGFSQGGVMGLDRALRSSFLLGGVIVVSGFCLDLEDYPQAFGPYAKEQKIVATHGSRDEIVPRERAQKDYEALKSFGVSLEWFEYNKPHSFELKTEIPFLERCFENWMEG